MEPEIVFEDDFLLVINKPSGWVVNEAGTTGKSPVVQAWLRENFNYPLSKSREERSGIVHRLDKETSGVLVVAKTRDAFEDLQKQFKNREVEKTYIALVHGEVEPSVGTIEAPVGRLPWNRERFGVLPGGRKAETRYRSISNFQLSRLRRAFAGQAISNEELTLLELYPKTGRTHQIRIHLKYLGHPIVSDDFYAGRKTARADRLWCPRLFLHAKKISIKHPQTAKRLSFESEPQADLKKVLNNLLGRTKNN